MHDIEWEDFESQVIAEKMFLRVKTINKPEVTSRHGLKAFSFAPLKAIQIENEREQKNATKFKGKPSNFS